jgi:hypothetical protein
VAEKQLAGAPDTLKWVEKEEAEARDAYEARKRDLEAAIADERDNPPDKDGTDWGKAVDLAESNLLKAEQRVQRWQKQLLGFDKQVPSEKRDVTEKITRDEGERVFRNWAIASRGMAQNYITSICQDVFTCKTPADLYKLASERFSSIISSSIADCVREAQLPLWCEQAVKEVL